MKCKNCGNKMPISKPLLICAIIEGIVIIFLLIIIFVLGLNIAQREGNLPTDEKSQSAAAQITDSVNSTPYYQNCKWCPNYGYITGAKPTNWELNDDNPIYEYSFEQNQMDKYIKELEKTSFEKNPFSNGDMTIYSRSFLNKTQSIVLSPDEKNGTIFIYMTEE